jgi:hypothetical protein
MLHCSIEISCRLRKINHIPASCVAVLPRQGQTSDPARSKGFSLEEEDMAIGTPLNIVAAVLSLGLVAAIVFGVV